MRPAVISTISFALALLMPSVAMGKNFTAEEVCKGYLAASNGREPGSYHTVGEEDGIHTIGHKRAADGKLFVYLCKLEENRIRWRDQNMSAGWNTNLLAHFQEKGNVLIITETFQNEIMGIYEFKKSDFN